MKLNKEMTDYMSSQRWCNFKEELRQNKVSDFNYTSIPFDEGEKLLVIGKITLSLESPETRYFIMPLAKENNASQSENTITLNGTTYSDAVKKDDFWKSFTKLLNDNDQSITFPNGWKMQYNNLSTSNILISEQDASSRPLGVEQSNTTLAIGDDTIAFKLERMISFSQDINPEFEMNEKLMKEECTVMPQTYAYLTLHDNNGAQASAGIFQEFVKNRGDLWNYSLEYLKDKLHKGYLTQTDILPSDNPEFMDLIKNLSLKTQEMGNCLSRPDNNEAFTPEPVDANFIHSYEKQMTVLLYQTHRNIVNNVDKLPEPTQSKAHQLLDNWNDLTNNYIATQLNNISQSPNKGYVSRVHGDFHLGQVMVTNDNDLKFIDFAGEPDLPIEKRRQKHIYVRDIAGMYRSIKGYLGAVAVEEYVATAPDEQTAQAMRKYASKAIKPIINASAQTFLGQHNLKERWLSLEVLRKNLYEVNYEVNNRPQMAYVAINGLSDLLQKTSKSKTNSNNISR